MQHAHAIDGAVISSPDSHEPVKHTDVSSNVKYATFLAILLPFLGLIAAVYLLWGRGVTALDLALFIGLYAVTGMGITIGFHRLLTHRAFDTNRPIKCLLAIAGSMAVQGSVMHWVAIHRRHHQHSDEEADPHSPHAYGAGVLSVLRGFWHSHVGWLLAADAPDLAGYVCDLRRDRLTATISKLFPLWAFLGLLIPAVIGGLVTRSWFGALTGFIWGGLVRVFIVHHVTWSINSVCHIWGGQPFQTGDKSRNNALFGFLAWGEGWHNNHHAFPTSARHGLRWWQFDMSYLVIRTLSLLRLVWNVRLPAKDALVARRAGGPAPGNDVTTTDSAAAKPDRADSGSQLLHLILPTPAT